MFVAEVLVEAPKRDAAAEFVAARPAVELETGRFAAPALVRFLRIPVEFSTGVLSEPPMIKVCGFVTAKVPDSVHWGSAAAAG